MHDQSDKSEQDTNKVLIYQPPSVTMNDSRQSGYVSDLFEKFPFYHSTISAKDLGIDIIDYIRKITDERN